MPKSEYRIVVPDQEPARDVPSLRVEVLELRTLVHQAARVSLFYENYDASLDDYDAALSKLKAMLLELGWLEKVS